VISQPNILLISGSGQNTGKTTLACKMIEYYSKNYEITGIKISHHFHTLTYIIPKVFDKKEFIIYEETERNTLKDSSRMLKAGAMRVFFMVSNKEHLGLAMKELLSILSPANAIICESGGLADFYRAGLHLYLKRPDNTNKNLTESNVIEVNFDGNTFNLDFSKIVFEDNSWKLNNR
jgi:hypothetical protein